MIVRKLLTLIISIIIFHNVNAQYRIAVIPKGNIGQFWDQVNNGAEVAANEFGVKLIFRGSTVEENIDSQIEMIRIFMRNNVDAIVLAPVHKDRLVPVVKEASEKGIKIIIIDSALSGNYHESFIATDNYLAGRKAGEEFIKLIGDESAGIIRNRRGNASTEMREQGFLDVMKENNIEVLVDVYAGSVYGSAVRASKRAVNSNPKVKGYFSSNEIGVLSLTRALEFTGKLGKVRFIGFDISDEIQENINAGKMDGVIVQQPELMGYLGVKTAVEVLEGKEVRKNIVVETEYLTKE